MKRNKLLTGIMVAIAALAGLTVLNTRYVMAAGYGLTVAPMNQKVVINPGESFEGAFKISNPAGSDQSTHYTISAEPFYVDNDHKTVYEAEGDTGRIADWITFNVPTEGKLAPNETKEVMFTITVPKDAPSGGQYLAITTTSEADGKDAKDGANGGSDSQTTIEEIRRVAHLLYAEITGATVKSGEITEANVPGFMLSGKITGSSSVRNTGNVHGTATYKMQVFPLFSNEEVFTNVEKPETKTVLPNRSLYNELSWDETPSIGIFNVVYTVEFEGSTAEVKKLVIICPLWLLFVIVFAIVAIIIFFVIRAKKRANRRENA